MMKRITHSVMLCVLVIPIFLSAQTTKVSIQEAREAAYKKVIEARKAKNLPSLNEIFSKNNPKYFRNKIPKKDSVDLSVQIEKSFLGFTGKSAIFDKNTLLKQDTMKVDSTSVVVEKEVFQVKTISQLYLPTVEKENINLPEGLYISRRTLESTDENISNLRKEIEFLRKENQVLKTKQLQLEKELYELKLAQLKHLDIFTNWKRK